MPLPLWPDGVPRWGGYLPLWLREVFPGVFAWLARWHREEKSFASCPTFPFEIVSMTLSKALSKMSISIRLPMLILKGFRD
jgi:hypothetical protein